MQLEHRVPQVYVEESRDFQTLLRTYNTAFDVLKYETDTMKYLVSTAESNGKTLPLLKSKLGFFTKYKVSDEMLRGILSGFPSMVKNKGSLEAIREAINVFLKVLGIKTTVVIICTDADGDLVKGIPIGGHTIFIGINAAITDYYILEELFRYIMPAGFNYEFSFYKDLKEEAWILNQQFAKVVIASNEIGNGIRVQTAFSDLTAGGYPSSAEYEDAGANRMLNSTDLGWMYSGLSPATDSTMVLTTWDVGGGSTVTEYWKYYTKTVIGGIDYYQQCTSSFTWAADTYYIPTFLVWDMNTYFTLTTSAPADFSTKYFNYYKKVGDKFKNLVSPETWAADTYYKFNGF